MLQVSVLDLNDRVVPLVRCRRIVLHREPVTDEDEVAQTADDQQRVVLPEFVLSRLVVTVRLALQAFKHV